jgi:hypothetical protein
MSGYNGQHQSQESYLKDSERKTYKNVGVLSAKLLKEGFNDPPSIKKVVEKLAEAAVNGSVEARANLCLYMGLNLQDMILVKGIINGAEIDQVDSYRNNLLELAYEAYDSKDTNGYIAYCAIAGYYPTPEVLEITSIN